MSSCSPFNVARQQQETGPASNSVRPTGTLAITLTDPSGVAVQQEVWAVVYVDNQTAMRGMLATLNNGQGGNIRNASATLNADKLFPTGH